jgi:hypothetical protein
MAADLESAGFEVREDSGITDWDARWANGQSTVKRRFVRIAVASRV